MHYLCQWCTHVVCQQTPRNKDAVTSPEIKKILTIASRHFFKTKRKGVPTIHYYPTQGTAVIFYMCYKTKDILGLSSSQLKELNIHVRQGLHILKSSPLIFLVRQRKKTLKRALVFK